MLSGVESTSEESELIYEEVMGKVCSIFIERSSILFSQDQTLLWLKEVIGFILNKIDSGDLQREGAVA